MDKPYKKEYTFIDLLWSIIELIKNVLNVFSKKLAEEFYRLCKKHLPGIETPQEIALEEAQQPTPAAPYKEEAVTPSVPTPEIDLSTTRGFAETQLYIDRGPSLPEHYGDDRIVALPKDPHCVFVYWDLKGPKSQEALQYHKGAKSWLLRVHHYGKDTYHDVDIDVNARNWYLSLADNMSYVIDLACYTHDGEFLTIASSNPVHTPRAGMSQEYAERWGLIFREAEKVTPEHAEALSTGERKELLTEGALPIPFIREWYEGLLRTRVPGSSIPRTQKKGQGE